MTLCRNPTDRPSSRLARHLGGADDGRLSGVSRIAPPRRRAVGRRGADAAGVEQLVALSVRSRRRRWRSGEAEGEDALPLQEERALLVVEGLVGRQVDDRRVGFHLAEVRVDGRVQREVRGEADLRVEPDRSPCRRRPRRRGCRPLPAATRPARRRAAGARCGGAAAAPECRAAHRSCACGPCPGAG